jgi:hypothetical protein
LRQLPLARATQHGNHSRLAAFTNRLSPSGLAPIERRIAMTLKTGASIAVLVMALGITPATAQTTTTEKKPSATTEVPKTPVSGQIMTQDSNSLLARDVIGLAVYSPDKTKIGNINDLILSKDGQTVEGFVIGVGGFLGIGEKAVALKMDRLRISNTAEGAVQLTMDAKKEELANAPAFKSKREVDNDKRAPETPRTTPTRPSTGQ